MSYILAITILILPTYALRFTVFGVPLNFLMLWIFFFWLLFAANLIRKKQLLQFWQQVKNTGRTLLLLILSFLLAGSISVFTEYPSAAKLAQFVVLFLQPVSLFFMVKFITCNSPGTKKLLFYACYGLLAAMGIWSAIQYFTLLSLPVQYWGNSVEPKRALGFFGHPNFYSLFSAPLLAFLLPDMISEIKAKKSYLKAVLWAFGLLGLGLSLSRAGWLGLGISVLIFLLLTADKKILKTAAITSIILFLIAITAPNFRYRLLLPFYGEKSAVSRFSLWESGWKGIKESPLFGLGLKGFSNNWSRLNTDPGLAADSHNLPHNIFLNFWLETGILGLGSFIGLSFYAIRKGFKEKTNPLLFGAALFLISLLIQGQIDNPYFKNDLAAIFWIILSLI